ncbi:alanine:cation symporter family protein [Priestia megaterium]|uniref:alanine:cation symporter family protein n=1 Tax=Priestia megaterium TaxID=1404 RepID=UPI0039E12332
MISTISEMIWSTPMLYLCIGVGLLFTILTRFVQVRYLKDMSTQAPDGSFIVGHLKGVEAGPQYTQQAVETVLSGFGSGFVAVSLVFFAFTTIMSQYYIAETNLAYVMKGKQNKIVSMFLKAALLATTLYGSIRTAEAAWALADIGVGIMVWLNLIAILILAKPALITLKDYRQQRKLGIDPIFSPRKLGIQNADY